MTMYDLRNVNKVIRNQQEYSRVYAGNQLLWQKPEVEPEPEVQILGEGQTSIGSDAYRNKGLTGAITIADSVTSIGENAFYQNQLTSLVIPDSVTSIGANAFGDNPLTEVSIGPNTTYESSSFPSSAVITVRDEPEPETEPEVQIFGEGETSIADGAYRGQSITGPIAIADGVTSIGANAFRENQITSVVFPESLTVIKRIAFDDNQITSLVIPDSVTSIEAWAFDLNPLEEVSISPYTKCQSNSFPDGAVINHRGVEEPEEGTKVPIRYLEIAVSYESPDGDWVTGVDNIEVITMDGENILEDTTLPNSKYEHIYDLGELRTDIKEIRIDLIKDVGYDLWEFWVYGYEGTENSDMTVIAEDWGDLGITTPTEPIKVTIPDATGSLANYPIWVNVKQ